MIINIHTRFYMITLPCLTKNRTILDQNKRNKPNILSLVYSTVLKPLVNFKSISLAMMLKSSHKVYTSKYYCWVWINKENNYSYWINSLLIVIYFYVWLTTYRNENEITWNISLNKPKISQLLFISMCDWQQIEMKMK